MTILLRIGIWNLEYSVIRYERDLRRSVVLLESQISCKIHIANTRRITKCSFKLLLIFYKKR